MHQVHLADHLYREAEERALRTGYGSVDEYVADVLSSDLHEENQDSLFTTERVAQLDRVSAEIRAGEKTHSSDAVREHFRKKWEAWPESPTA